MSNFIGVFKAETAIGKFKFAGTAEAAHLRTRVEKFVVHNPITDSSWNDYCELRSLRELARTIETEEEAQSYDVLWDEFCDALDENGASKFGMALIIERSVLKVEPWA